MVGPRWIKTYFLLIPVLQITAAVTEQHLSFTVRVGDKAPLPCENVIKAHKCDSTTWLFSDLGRSAAVALVEFGQIHKNAKSKSDRLSVTENCSLIIKKVTVKDVGRYTCRQFISGQQQGKDIMVHLSVTNSEDTNVATTKSTTLGTNPQGWWRFILVAVVLAFLITVVAVVSWKRAKARKTQVDDKMELTSNPAVTQSAPEPSQDTADPEGGVSYASISYIKETNSKARVWGKDDDDEGDAVTYSTVKAPSSSSPAGASADPSDLYATVNKPKK